MLTVIDFYAENPIVGKTLQSCILEDTNVYDDITGNGDANWTIKNSNDVTIYTDNKLYLYADEMWFQSSVAGTTIVSNYGMGFTTYGGYLGYGFSFNSNGYDFNVDTKDGTIRFNTYNPSTGVWGIIEMVDAQYIKIYGGSNGQVLTTNGSGSLSWTTPTSGLTANDFIFNEVPSGTPNGSTTNFTLLYTPVNTTTQVFINGLLQKLNVNYTVSGSTIIFVVPPLTNDTVIVHYIKDSSSGGSGTIPGGSGGGGIGGGGIGGGTIPSGQ